uniref:Uncharacterized protein n=1 Tax=Oryza rufipogon TaxID=4529 RepID=A0A0E0QP89_ORYRU
MAAPASTACRRTGLRVGRCLVQPSTRGRCPAASPFRSGGGWPPPLRIRRRPAAAARGCLHPTVARFRLRLGPAAAARGPCRCRSAGRHGTRPPPTLPSC